MAHHQWGRNAVIDPERWHEMDRLFAEALERPLAERPAFLDEICAGDPDLRRELERLLAADDEAAAFLERPAGELLGLALDDREEGGQLGPYRLLRRIGGGGMGTVYLARREDEQYQRDVAIKILRSGLASTEALHRFLAERQILARLEHPNIARLYDGGCTEDGRPYLVMELIEGTPVDEYCDRNRLTVDQRLDLFRRICAAVQYAHQNLLVHRDLKPGNILVTAEGEPKLLDFGIAKRLAREKTVDSRMTQTGLRMLTPSYASPEQVKGGAITTASDVYALGVLLYELLAGRSPYETTGAPYEIERAICEKQPERPSAALFRAGAPTAEQIAQDRNTRPPVLRRRLQGDLDNIILMALRKEPQRRYESVAHLSRDVERHLKDLPVHARPDTALYRTRKFLRRRRATVAAAAVAALLAGGFVTSVVAQGRRIERERDKAEYALSFLVETFQQADPYQAQGERLTAKQILDQGAERISRELADQPDVQAAVMDAIGEVDRSLGRYAEAQPLLERSLELRRKLYGLQSLPVAESLDHLSGLAADRLDLATAEKLLRRSLAMRRRLLGDGDVEVAKTLNQLGELLVTKGAPAVEIERIQQEALAIAREAEDPAAVAQSILHLARAKQAAGSYDEAEKLFRQGLDLERRVLKPGDPELYREQTAFGEILINMGKPVEAEKMLRESLAAQRRILGSNHPDVAVTLGNLAMAVYERGSFAEAETLNREVLALVRTHYGPSHWLVPAVLGNLAAALQSQEKVAEAIPFFEEALAVRRRTLGEGHPLVAQALLLLAGAHRRLAEYPEALDLAREALEILEKAEGPDHPHLAYPAREIGRIYMAQQLYREAEPYLRRSLEIRRRELTPDHPEVARAKISLADCLIERGRYDEATVLLREAQATLVAQGGPQDGRVLEAQKLIAKLERLRR
jgi:eukaryotic-like serine/threonine-protein kinase